MQFKLTEQRYYIPHFRKAATPINTRLYTLPGSQKQEIDRHSTKLLKEGIIEISDSPCSSPTLVVPQKTGVDGE